MLTFNEACVNESSVATTFTANRKQCVAGTARTFFTLEQQFTDLNSGSGLFEIFSGQEVNTLQATIPTSGQATFDINLVGMSIALLHRWHLRHTRQLSAMLRWLAQLPEQSFS